MPDCELPDWLPDTIHQPALIKNYTEWLCHQHNGANSMHSRCVKLVRLKTTRLAEPSTFAKGLYQNCAPKPGCRLSYPAGHRANTTTQTGVKLKLKLELKSSQRMSCRTHMQGKTHCGVARPSAWGLKSERPRSGEVQRIT